MQSAFFFISFFNISNIIIIIFFIKFLFISNIILVMMIFLDSASSREDAKAKCEAEAPGNHLWLINDQQEMENILEWFTK